MKKTKNTKFKNRKVINLLILAMFLAIITAYAISNTRAQETTTEETTENTDKVVWVESTETDEEGNILKVPVPVGYTASQVPGETTVNGGFVIYEGEIDWSKIVIEEEEEETTTETEGTETESTETETETQSETENEVTTASFSLEDSTGENNSQEEINTTEDNSISQENNETEDNTNTDENNEIENNVENTIEATSFNLNNNQEESETTENQEKTENIESEETQEIATYSTETTETEETITLLELQQSVNQYVWVPIYDVSEIYGVDENGKIWGKLYDYSKTGRTALNWTEENGIMSITDVSRTRNPDVLQYLSNHDIDSQLQDALDGTTRYELLAEELEQYYYEIIKSIKKYGGFYIGRYETGDLNRTYPTNAVVQKGNETITSANWYEMYEACKNLKGENDNVITTMISGSLWDATLEWFVDSEVTNSLGNIITCELLKDSTSWGNYKNTTFEYRDVDGEIKTKEIDTTKKIPTGSTEYTKVNNIYDMAGNVWEWTTEMGVYERKVARAGFYGTSSQYQTFAAHRSGGDLRDQASDVPSVTGTRAILLIK